LKFKYGKINPDSLPLLLIKFKYGKN